MSDILFRPFRLKSLQLDNRIVMAPMTRGFSPGGVPGADVAEYYRRRAAGGVGLIVTEGTTVDHPVASSSTSYPHFHGDAALAGWTHVVDTVHAAGGRIAPQLWHVGMMRNARRAEDPSLPSAGPSGMNVPGKVVGPAMTANDIADVIAAFGKGAADAKRIGFDCVELHGAHGYLLDQFFWAGTNIREDTWGGDLVARARFGLEIVRAVRAAIGPDMVLILRLSQWKQQDFTQRLAQTPQEWEAFVTPFVDAGVDIFHCSNRRFWEPEFDGSDMNLAGWTKKLTGIPTITVGSVGLNGEIDFIESMKGVGAAVAGLEDLERRMDRGDFDLVAVGRALLANPDWANLVREGRSATLKPYSKEYLAELV